MCSGRLHRRWPIFRRLDPKGRAGSGARARPRRSAFTLFAGITLDEFVSSHHFTITFAEQATFVLTDCGGSNGTFVNGERLKADPTRASDQTTVRFGDTVAQLVISDEDDNDDPPPEMIGQSPRFRVACAAIRDAALVDLPALILGETGTGKEVAARAIHALSRRKGKPFIAVNCAAIAETLIESVMFGYVKGLSPARTEIRQDSLKLPMEARSFSTRLATRR